MPTCSHPDVRAFDGLRCCLSCGEALVDDEVEAHHGKSGTESSTYQYKPLALDIGQEIRLLYLYPGDESDVIRCDIAHVNLLDNPVYEAVSYTWADLNGDTSLCGLVSCGAKEIAITRNCQSVLRYLRQKHTRRKLWIDALCIDQSNVVERSHQVRLMASIYSNASQVLAYLGSGEKGVQSFAIRRIMEYLDDTPKRKPVSWRPDTQEVSEFLRLPYFDRVWALQEIALARLVTLIAGDRAIHWTAGVVQDLLTLCPLQITIPSMLQWMPSSRPEEEDILDVLRRCRNCSAKDTRDKIFAVLGLVSESQAQIVRVDYSLTTLEVCIDLAVTMIRDHGRMDILVHNASQWTNAGFECSWVPLWHVKCMYKTLPLQFSSSLVDHLASAWFLPKSDESTSLYVSNETQQAPHEDFRFRFAYGATTRIPGGPAITLPCLEIRAHFLDTITLTTSLHPIAHESYHLPLVYNDNAPCSRCNLKQKPSTDVAYDRDRRKDFEFELMQTGFDVANFRTVRSFGFVRFWQPREQALPGDTIWALSGLAVPMILRRSGDHYFLVGECYLYRAALPHLCFSCGGETRPWPMVSEVISIR